MWGQSYHVQALIIEIVRFLPHYVGLIPFYVAFIIVIAGSFCYHIGLALSCVGPYSRDCCVPSPSCVVNPIMRRLLLSEV